MKNNLFVVILILFSVFTFGSEIKVEIHIETIPKGPSPRSLVKSPTVLIETATAALSVSFLSPNSDCTLCITDADGSEVYKGLLITDGSQQSINLGSQDGLYYIQIETKTHIFEGEFHL